MQEFLKEIFLAVITEAVLVLTAYIVVLVRKVGENAAANTENVKAKTYIMEAAEAIAKSKYVLTQRFSTPWTEHAFLEPEFCNS